MIQVPKTRLTLIQGVLAARVVGPGAEVQRLRGHAGTEMMMRGHLPDDRVAPAIGAGIAGRLSGVKPLPEPVTLIVITDAAGPVDANGHGARRRLGHAHQRAGTGRLRGSINGVVEGMGIGGMIIDGGKKSCIA